MIKKNKKNAGAVNSTALIISKELSVLLKEMKILFSSRCRASLIAVCRVPPLQTASDQSALTGQELCVPHTAGQMSASESGTPEKKEAAHARRLASARFDGLACRKNCLIIDMKMFF